MAATQLHLMLLHCSNLHNVPQNHTAVWLRLIISANGTK